MVFRNQSTDAEVAIDAALALRDTGRGVEAVPMLQAALEAHPANPRLWQMLGTVHRALEQSAAAIDAFREATRLAPADIKANYGVAQASMEAGRPATALFDHLHQLAPTDGAILLGRSAAQLAEGKGDAAVTALAAIVAANPLWLEGQASLARLRWQMGDDQGFAAGYVAALRAHPAQLPLWLALIDLLVHVERYDDASAVIARAFEATGAIEQLLLAEAICASELGDVAAADAAFARLAGQGAVAIVEHRLRHLLRNGRADQAAALAETMLDRRDTDQLWPYVSLAWRVTGDPRIDWLEGDPALVASYDLDLSDIAALAERLRGLHRAKRDPLGQSVRGGTQTDGPLFAHEAPEIQAVRAEVVAAVERHIAALGTVDPAHPTRRHIGERFRFAGSWSVRLTGAGHHSPHVHPQGWLSSALYVAVPTQAEMGPAPNGWLQLGVPPAALGLGLEPIRGVEPRPARLALFPSTMWHGTAPIDGGERLSIAFDIAPIG